MYFSGRAAEFFRDSDLYGVMLSYKSTGGQQRALDMGCFWMLDNGAFSGNFDEPRWTNAGRKPKCKNGFIAQRHR